MVIYIKFFQVLGVKRASAVKIENLPVRRLKNNTEVFKPTYTHNQKPAK